MSAITKYLVPILIAAGALILLVIFQIVPISSVPAWAALLLSLFGIYYTSESLIMDVKIKHSDDLHKFISEWKKIHEGFYTKVIPEMGTEFSRNTKSIDKLQFDPDYINGDIFYEDLIKNHLGKYRRLGGRWNNYNSDVRTYETALNKASEKIETLAMIALKKAGIEPKKGYGYENMEIITPGFADQLLMSYKGAITEKQQMVVQETGYTLNKQPMKAYVVYANRQNGAWQVDIAHATSPETAQQYISVFESLRDSKLKSDAKLKEWDVIIKKLDAKIDAYYIEIAQDLVNLDKYPVFGEKCSFVQRAL
jgi:hypothetical protein